MACVTGFRRVYVANTTTGSYCQH